MKEQPSIDNDNNNNNSNNKNDFLLIKGNALISENEDEKAVLNDEQENIKEIPQSKNIEDIK